MTWSSFKTNSEIFTAPLALPGDIDFSSWAEAWEVGNIGGYALNSVIVTTAAVLVILLFAALAAFAFSRFQFRGRGLLLGLFALGLLMPIQSYFIAQNSLFELLNLKDTRWALIIPYAAMGLSLAVYLLKVYLDTLPRELFEAARVDGCGDVRMFTTLVLPLLRPGLGHRRHLLGAERVERVPARPALRDQRRPEDDPHRTARLLQSLRDRLPAALLGAHHHHPPDGGGLRDLPPPSRGRSHRGIAQVEDRFWRHLARSWRIE